MITVLWAGFIVLVIFLLALDLGVLNRKEHVIGIKEAFLWSAFWIFLSLLFSAAVYFIYENHLFDIGLYASGTISGHQALIQYLTGYIIEKSLSLDNIFVIALIFGYFKVPAIYQHRVLFWGIVGAVVLRGVMILAGAVLINNFSWIVYVFGGFLIITALRMLKSNHEEIDPDKSVLVRLARKLYPVTKDFHGKNFFVKVNNKKAATPLFIALLVVESSDILFAVDSIPAIFAITRDPFIVFTSNIFAVLGLRALYFALAAMITKFYYLKYSLVIILLYVGVKMLLTYYYHINSLISLAIIIIVLSTGIIASMIKSKNDSYIK
ncbi:MAG: TerC family protein [Ignavibacteriae bacterium]|nr:TerC family protein [Ignavibacteriota bacterium]NOG98915.1 TerC family protein [Ignavibacteriota bacterium]